MDNITLVEALGFSVLGLSIVFCVLISLWVIILVMAKILGEKPAPKAEAAAAPAAVVSTAPPAEGTAGELKIFDVPDRDAALVMAIVANKMGKPLNELRFKSIKEVK